MNTMTIETGTNNNASNHSFANTNAIPCKSKEITTMKTIKLFAFAVSALFCALTFGASPAKADVLVTAIRAPYYAQGTTGNETALQFLVANTSGSTVNNQVVKTFLTGIAGIRPIILNLQSSYFSMSAYQQKWVNVQIPSSSNGVSLWGKNLFGTASIGTHAYPLNFVDNVPASDVAIGNVTPPSNSTNGASFKVTVVNNGTRASVAKTLTVTLVDYADGPVGPYYTETATVGALQPGQSQTLTFHLQNPNGYETRGVISIGVYGAKDYHTQQVAF